MASANGVTADGLVAVPALARAHVGLYVYRRDTLLTLAALPAAALEREESLEQLRALAEGIRIRVVDTRHVAAGVDTLEDLERVRLALRSLQKSDELWATPVAPSAFPRSEGGTTD